MCFIFRVISCVHLHVSDYSCEDDVIHFESKSKFCLSVFLWGIQTQLIDNFCWTEFLRSSGTITPLLWLKFRHLFFFCTQVGWFWTHKQHLKLLWNVSVLIVNKIFHSSYFSISTCTPLHLFNNFSYCSYFDKDLWIIAVINNSVFKMCFFFFNMFTHCSSLPTQIVFK